MNRAMADHFLFCMNTDFKRVAQDFADAPQAEKDIDGFLPYLPGGAADKLTRGGSVADAEESIVTLRDAFEKTQRVRPASLSASPRARSPTGALNCKLRQGVLQCWRLHSVRRGRLRAWSCVSFTSAAFCMHACSSCVYIDVWQCNAG